MLTLDTNICIGLLRGERSLVERLSILQPGDVAISSIVRAELLYGARNSGKVSANLKRLEAFFAPLILHPFDERAADQYGILRAQLRKSGRPVGGNDMLIAATALAHDAILVTRNSREFAQLAGLRVEEW